MHIYGDQHPETGLKNKLKRWQFSNTLEIIDPITGQKNKEPMKPFMVNQLTLSFERSRLMLSPWDETLAKQLLDYEVKKVSESGKPIYTSENEHFCDALGLAHLAFVLEFKELTDTIKDFETTSKMAFSNKSIGKAGMTAMLHDIQSSYSSNNQIPQKSSDELDRQRWFKVSPGYRSSTYRNNNNWGTRGSRSGGCVRSMW